MKNSNQKFIITIDILKDADSLINQLKNSLYLQKQFLNIVKYKISSFLKDKGKNSDEIIYLTEKLIDALPKIIPQLGIPFVYYFFNEENILQSFLNLYYDDQYNDKVSEIYKACVNIFSFSENYDKFKELKNNLIGCGIIQNNEEYKVKKNDKTPEQNLFEEITLMLQKIPELKNIGDVKEIITEFENEYYDKIKKIKDLKNKMILTNTQLEFYQDLIKPCEDYLKSIKNNVNNKNDDNNDDIKNKKDDNFLIEDKDKKVALSLDERTFFYMNEKIQEKPNQVIEFKNYQLPLDDKRNEIRNILCSFLNTRGGRIYIGINDNNIVEGISLNYKKRDILRNYIVNLTYDFYPKCRVDKIFVYFIPIKEFKSKKYIQKKYVIKIRIYPGDPDVLYSLSNKGGYFSTIRKNGKCINLNSKEIYEEILDRNKIKNLIKDDKYQILLKENEIKDPEPEINQQDLENDYEDDDIPIFANNNLNNINKKVREDNNTFKK